MKAIILAGGFGTRLQSVVKDVPKPMADINTRPFLYYILKKLSFYNIDEVVISVGYKQDIIKKYFKNSFDGMNIIYSSEKIPLGTGGALKKALTFVKSTENILVLNGDTFFDINIEDFFNSSKSYRINLAIKPMQNFDRYGSIEILDNKIISFKEKQFTKKGFINTGAYFINKDIFKDIDKDIFSFEEFLVKEKDIYIYKADNYFIDIGIPDDYEKAKNDFKDMF